MPRPIVEEKNIHLAIRDVVANQYADTVQEAIAAIAAQPVVVIGMAQNPVSKRARKVLTEAGIAYHYLEYGSYFNNWRRRTALKMWCGWPTFPIVFVKGQLIGGADDLQRLMVSGELKKLLG